MAAEPDRPVEDPAGREAAREAAHDFVAEHGEVDRPGLASVSS